MALVLKGRTLLKGSTIIGRRPYALFGIYNPELVLDFASDYYRTNSAASTFSDAVTHSRTSNATMVDTDGLLKWAPHNLLPTPDNWSSVSSTTVTSGQADPDGGTSAFLITHTASSATAYQSTSVVAGVAYTMTATVRADNGAGWVRFYVAGKTIYFDVLNDWAAGTSTADSSTVTPLGGGWYRVEVVATAATTASAVFGAQLQIADNSATEDDTGDLYFYQGHAYRSDLGGMVNNPDAAVGFETYVPTTTAAVYSPRRNNHVYNGSAWVNEGLLHESAAATNLVTYSSDFTDASWIKSGVTAAAASETGPDGQASMSVITLSSADQQHDINSASAFGPVTVDQVATISILVRAGTLRYVGVRLFGSTDKWSTAIFDLTTASVTQESVGSLSGSIVSSNIESLGGGLYRLSLTASDNAANDKFVVQFHNTGTPTLNEFGGDSWLGAGETVEIGFAQLETGSIPTSYIPTAGATATRAAETLTVPIANVPYPVPVEVTGTELVTNGTFDTNTTGWTANANTTLSVDTGRLKVLSTAAAASSAYQVITTVVGQRYFVKTTGLETTSTSSNARTYVGTSLGGTQYLNILGSGDTEQTGEFIATTTTAYIQLTQNTPTSGLFMLFDNISVKEINPLAVSIQMDGQMTYADTDNSNAFRVVSWSQDSSNGLVVYGSTAGTETGRVLFYQEAGNVSDQVGSSIDAYSSGINVPFNIASRHGSTFINGAVGGTALTANLTPVAFPNLSAANVQLGTVFTGNIGKFRMWGDTTGDIGDTGIAGATLPSLEPSLSLTFDGSETSFTVLDWSA